MRSAWVGVLLVLAGCPGAVGPDGESDAGPAPLPPACVYEPAAADVELYEPRSCDDGCGSRVCVEDPAGRGRCCGPEVCWDDIPCPDGRRCVGAGPGVSGFCADAPRDCCLCLLQAGCLFDDNAAPPLGTDYLDDPGNSIERCVADFDSLPDGEQVFVGYSDECRYDEGLCDGCWL